MNRRVHGREPDDSSTPALEAWIGVFSTSCGLASSLLYIVP
jgi:hypothetical protein